MPDQTEQSIEIAAAADRVMAVIADFERYPEWVDAAKKVTVKEQLTQGAHSGRARLVRFEVDAGILRDSYDLQYTWSDDDRSVRWTLLESTLMRSQDGAYELVERGSGSAIATVVTYRLEVALAIPMIGRLRRKAEKVITDAALRELKRRVEAE